jgi:hypothetical protein
MSGLPLRHPSPSNSLRPRLIPQLLYSCHLPLHRGIIHALVELPQHAQRAMGLQLLMR